jgi:transcriptional regulator with XRE-family HTH domain
MASKKPKATKSQPAKPILRPHGEFGDLLRSLRQGKGIRLLEMSEQIRTTLPYLSDVERGRRDPLSNDRILRVAEYLEADPLPLLESAIKVRDRVTLDVDGDARRLRVATLLSLLWPKASDGFLDRLIRLLKDGV